MTNPGVSVSPRSLWRILSAAVACIAAIAVWRTATVFSGTVDEPAHIAAGVELLSGGRYAYDLQHPPLGRIAAAIGPLADGARFTGAPGVYDEGAIILGSGARYVKRLAAARHGEIVFFMLLAATTWWWGMLLLDDAGGYFATLLLVTNPNILAHAGLATTDIACAATTTLALLSAARWLDDASGRRTFCLGLSAGMAIGSRLSALGFMALPFAAFWVMRRAVTRTWLPGGADSRTTLVRLVGAGVLAAVTIAAAYFFHLGAFVSGVDTFLRHGSSGHPTFLLGTPRNRGWWYYYPVAVLVKTPLPLLLLAAIGSIAVLRQLRARSAWQPAAPLVAGALMLALSMTVRVDLGVRLVLPIYPLMAVMGAVGIRELLSQPARRAGAVLAALLLFVAAFIPMRAHPDYLAYFNLFAGAHPEHVLVDSNLDWGQDLYRLRDTLQARGIRDSVRVAYFGTADLAAAGVPNSRLLGLHERATGWIAASETFLAGEWVGGAYAWLLNYPATARIGPSMRLWYIPADSTTGSSPR
ncbi:MAG TPA: hypothetical protein VH277_01275 [Gemmatimonadaceae bacterium]|nr:hypothetical protein [Gemmatimonadaceae bacterium]